MAKDKGQGRVLPDGFSMARRTALKGAALGVAALGLPLAASRTALAAQSYPQRPLRILVPFGPGSGSDVYARHFGAQLAERIGQAVVVENRPGAGGALAVQTTLSSPADGYTILLGSNSPMAVNVSAYKNLAYDPVKDVAPICGLTRSMAIIVVPAKSELRSVADLVARGKRTPMLNMGTYSPGYQLSVAAFLQQAGFQWQAVPYRGLSQTLGDLIGGQVDVAVIDTPGTVQNVTSGQIRALAVTGTSRHPELPDVPTLQELGYDGATHYSWTSLWVRHDTPSALVDVLSGHMLKILNDPAAAAFVSAKSGEVMPFGPAEMRKFQLAEIERFGKAVDALKFERI